MPNVLTLASNALGQIQNTPYYGTVAAPAPTDPTDPLLVVVPEIDTSFAWTFTGWGQDHGAGLPAVGAVCMVAFDNRRNLRLLWWDGSGTVQPAGNYAVLDIGNTVGGSGGSALNASAVETIGDPRWPKLARTGPFTIDFGAVTVSISASSVTGVATVTHALGHDPVAVVVTNNGTNNISGRWQVHTTGVSFDLTAFWTDSSTSHGAATPSMTWIAIG